MKTLLIALTILISSQLFGQITIIEPAETETIGKITKSNQYIILERIDDMYVFYFQNAKYSHITDIKKLKIYDKESLDTLYCIIKKDITELHAKDFERVIGLPDGKIYITYTKTRFQMSVSQKGQAFCYTSYLQIKYLDKLFGKESY